MNDANEERARQVSRSTRLVARIILVGLLIAGIIAFVTSSFGQNTLLICCGGGLLLALIGIISERGMRR